MVDCASRIADREVRLNSLTHAEHEDENGLSKGDMKRVFLGMHTARR